MVIQSRRLEAEVPPPQIAGLSSDTPRALLVFRCMYCNLHGVRRLHNVFSLRHFVRCAMSQKEELVRLERRLVFHDAVFRDANTVQPRAERAQSAHHHRAFKCGDDPCDQWTGYQYRPDTWNGKKSGSEQPPPDSTPEGPHLAPVLHAVAGVIVSDDVLVGMIILADNGHFLHIKPGPLQFLDRFLCCGVGLINSYHRVHFRHCLCSFLPRSNWFKFRMRSEQSTSRNLTGLIYRVTFGMLYQRVIALPIPVRLL